MKPLKYNYTENTLNSKYRKNTNLKKSFDIINNHFDVFLWAQNIFSTLFSFKWKLMNAVP